MDPVELTKLLGTLGVEPVDREDPNRAVLYLPELLAASKFFSSPPDKTFDPRVHEFVRPALTSSNLLNELARTLDLYVVPALNTQMRIDAQKRGFKTFEDLYKYYFYKNRYRDYASARDKFLQSYPKTAYVLQTVVSNFTNGLVLACNRVFDDRRMIERFFFNDRIVLGLSKIKTSGSDSHKGGKQVLILEFKIVPPHGMPFDKIIYKPSDVEADCLIIGNSAAINNLYNKFMPASLFEIFNNATTQFNKSKEGEMTALSLPTYKILPVKYFSKYRSPSPPFSFLRDLYGYIEFIDHSTGDFQIYARPNNPRERSIVDRLYLQLGHFIAIACAFGISDMHVENFIMHHCQAYPIDMEVSFGWPHDKVFDLGLLGDTGGISGFEEVGFTWSLYTAEGSPPTFDLAKLTHPSKNRLYCARDGLSELVPPDRQKLISGMVAGYGVLAAIARDQSQVLTAWAKRVASACVRLLPVTTGDFIAMRNHFFLRSEEQKQYKQEIIDYIAQEYESTKARYDRSSTCKSYLVWQGGEKSAIFKDICNLDIPVFYRPVSSKVMVDSFGNAVPPPEGEPAYEADIMALLWSRFTDPQSIAARITSCTKELAESRSLAGEGFSFKSDT